MEVSIKKLRGLKLDDLEKIRQKGMYLLSPAQQAYINYKLGITSQKDFSREEAIKAFAN